MSGPASPILVGQAAAETSAVAQPSDRAHAGLSGARSWRERLAFWWRRVARPVPASPPIVEIDVTDLAAVWLPYNREPWHAAANSPSADRPIDQARAESAPAVVPVGDPARPAAGPVAGTGAESAASGSASSVAGEPALPAPFGALLAPYVARCRQQGVWATIERAVAALTEHGDAPSLVLERGSHDREAKDLYSVRESLGRVSLRDHTAHVLEAMLALVREQYREPEGQIPRAALAALAHDLGKIPAWRQVKAYGKQDHAAIGAMKLREWVGADQEPWWFESVAAAVRDHHRRSGDPLAALLRQADLRAREREVAATTAGLRVAAFPAWMDAARWTALVAAEIDMLQKGNQWVAVTHGGVVYAKSELLLKAARTVMTEQQAVDLAFLADGERERATAKLVHWLKEQGWLADEIGDGYYGLPYDIELTPPGKPPMVLPPHYLVPLRVEVFGQEGVFRARKAGALGIVTDIRKRPIGQAVG